VLRPGSSEAMRPSADEGLCPTVGDVRSGSGCA
jgi:hypothetical protein